MCELVGDEGRTRKGGFEFELNGPLMTRWMTDPARKSERCVSNQHCNSLLCVILHELVLSNDPGPEETHSDFSCIACENFLRKYF